MWYIEYDSGITITIPDKVCSDRVKIIYVASVLGYKLHGHDISFLVTHIEEQALVNHENN